MSKLEKLVGIESSIRGVNTLAGGFTSVYVEMGLWGHLHFQFLPAP